MIQLFLLFIHFPILLCIFVYDSKYKKNWLIYDSFLNKFVYYNVCFEHCFYFVVSSLVFYARNNIFWKKCLFLDGSPDMTDTVAAIKMAFSARCGLTRLVSLSRGRFLGRFSFVMLLRFGFGFGF